MTFVASQATKLAQASVREAKSINATLDHENGEMRIGTSRLP